MSSGQSAKDTLQTSLKSAETYSSFCCWKTKKNFFCSLIINYAVFRLYSLYMLLLACVFCCYEIKIFKSAKTKKKNQKQLLSNFLFFFTLTLNQFILAFACFPYVCNWNWLLLILIVLLAVWQALLALF